MRGRFVLGGALCAVLFAVAASGASAAPQRKSAVVTLRILQFGSLQAGWDVLVKNFENVYPNIHVETTYGPPASYGTELVTQIQAGNPPDAFYVGPGNNNFYSVFPLGSQGKLLDLTGSPWQKRLPRYVKRYLQVHGKINANVLGYALSGLVYNRDLMSSLGVAPPKTLSDLIAFCGKAKAAGKIPMVVAGLGPGYSQLAAILMTAFVYSKDPNWNLERDQKKVSYTSSPLWKSAFQAIVQMNGAGCFGPAPAATTMAAGFNQMASGQAVIYVGAAPFIQAVQQINPNLNLGMINFPGLSAKDERVFVNWVGMGGSATTQHPKEVKTLLNFVSRPKQQTLFAKVANLTAPFDFAKGILASSLRELIPDVKAGRILPNPTYGFPSANAAILISAGSSPLGGLLTGQLSVESLLAQLDAAWDKRG
jgi:raffinose/stachyose/melibiose transport system substrate-binding protein